MGVYLYICIEGTGSVRIYCTAMVMCVLFCFNGHVSHTHGAAQRHTQKVSAGVDLCLQ